MKIALIINHNTAAPSLAQILKEINNDIYIPIECNSELYAFTGEEVKNVRTINDTILDSINFYQKFNDNDYKISLFVNQINNNYDMLILIPQIFNFYTITRILSEVKVKIITLIWGSIADYNISKNFSLLDFDKNYNNIYFGFANDKIYNEIPYNNLKHRITTPLSLNTLIFPYENKWIFNSTQIGMIIISRININTYENILFQKTEHMIKKYGLNLIFYGKNKILNFKYKEKFGSNIENIYQDMISSNYLIYLINEKNMIQYNALEAIFIGLPVFYLRTTLLAKLIDKYNYFECNTIDEMAIKIKYMKNLDKNEILRNTEIQKNALKYYNYNYSIENWQKVFNL